MKENLVISLVLFCASVSMHIGVKMAIASDNPIKIEFKLVENDDNEDNLIFNKEILLSTKDVESAELRVEEPPKWVVVSEDLNFKPTPSIVIYLQLTSDGKKKFEDITTKNVKRRLAIFIDDKYIMVPKIRDPIKSGTVAIIGHLTESEAKTIVDRINNRDNDKN